MRRVNNLKNSCLKFKSNNGNKFVANSKSLNNNLTLTELNKKTTANFKSKNLQNNSLEYKKSKLSDLRNDLNMTIIGKQKISKLKNTLSMKNSGNNKDIKEEKYLNKLKKDKDKDNTNTSHYSLSPKKVHIKKRSSNRLDLPGIELRNDIETQEKNNNINNDSILFKTVIKRNQEISEFMSKYSNIQQKFSPEKKLLCLKSSKLYNKPHHREKTQNNSLSKNILNSNPDAQKKAESNNNLKANIKRKCLKATSCRSSLNDMYKTSLLNRNIKNDNMMIFRKNNSLNSNSISNSTSKEKGKKSNLSSSRITQNNQGNIF